MRKPIDVILPPRCDHCYFTKQAGQPEEWYCYVLPERKFSEPCSRYDYGVCPRRTVFETQAEA